MIGIGYQDYKSLYEKNGGEIEGNERFLIYFGRAHVVDHISNFTARGPLKIGRGKFATAIMRGRNQPGVDFRIYSELILQSNEDTYLAETIIKDALSHRNIEMEQNQKELYDISDDELQYVVDTAADIVKSEGYISILEKNHYFKTSTPMIKEVFRKENTLESFF
jgi:hypothetical protein